MLAKTLLVLLASSLVASQSVPALGADCASPCAGIDKVASCTNGDQTDLGCICNVYQSVIPGACETCLNKADPGAQQSIDTFLSYCKSGVYNGITVTGVGAAPTGASGATAPAAAQTTTGASTGTQASTTATAATTSKKSAGSVNVAGMGFVGLVLAFGGALMGM